jgi:hypothetical protein
MRRGERSLLLHCLRLDVVEAAGRGSATLLSGILFSTLVGAAVAGIAAGEEPRSGAAVAFALLGLFALVDALGDVATAWLDPRDVTLLRTHGIAPIEYARARLLALQLPVAAKSLALVLPAACAAAAAGHPGRALAWIAAFLPFGAFLAAAGVLVLLLLRRAGVGARLRDLLAWLRALLLVAATGGWLVLPPAAAGGLARGVDVLALPSSWFAELALWLGGEPVVWSRVLLAVGGLAAVGVALQRALRSYLPLLEALAATPAAVRATASPPWRLVFERFMVAPPERPAFRLGLLLLRRERSFRLQAIPLLAYPLLFLSLGRGADDEGLFALLFCQLPALVLALTGMLLRFTDSPAGGFALAWHGGAAARSQERGARKACWWGVALPLALVITVLLIHDRGAWFGAAAGALGLCSSTVALLPAGGAPSLPFQERFRGRIDGGEVGRVFGLLALLFGVALLAWRVARAGPLGAGAVLLGSLATTALLLRRRPAEAAVRLEAVAADAGSGVGSAAGGAPFTLRLRRELRGLAAYFVGAALVLCAFYAWL